MVIGQKNICQNPKCCESSTQDRWNKKLEAYESRKGILELSLSIKLHGVIVIECLSIFARQVVRLNGCEIILTT
jgi:hypothetical protein